jgi:hypothetical protein
MCIVYLRLIPPKDFVKRRPAFLKREYSVLEISAASSQRERI